MMVIYDTDVSAWNLQKEIARMGFQYILFDLDGTLTDPATGITNSIMYSLNKYGIKVNDRSELYSFIGPPLQKSFEKFYGFSEEEAKKAVEYYREYYRDKGIFENKVYDGIRELLQLLKERKRTIILATSKPELYAKQILEHFQLSSYFDFIAGSELDGRRVNKDEVICYALNGCNIYDLSKVIMIGDREYDVFGAHKQGIKSIGVLYGYGDRNELENAGADYILETVADLINFFLNDTLLPSEEV